MRKYKKDGGKWGYKDYRTIVKYKKDLADLRDVLNKFYDTHGYDVKIRNTF